MLLFVNCDNYKLDLASLTHLNLLGIVPCLTRFRTNRPAADMEVNGEFDFWVIFEDFWRTFKDFWRN